MLLENLLRTENGTAVTVADIRALAAWQQTRKSDHEIAFSPARVLMQDFTGVPAVVDLAAMRDAVRRAGGDPQRINPQIPVDLVIDHSVMVDRYADAEAFQVNVAMEMKRNFERYAFLRWGQLAFDNFRVVPPGTGICHQVNLEYLARTVWQREEDGTRIAYPDTLVGTDSHTTMINGLAVLGWGVGGIEAEAAMLGQPISMIIPEVVGFRFHGRLREGVTATDLVLTVTEMLRKFGVVGKFVEFFGPGLSQLSLADRATIGNMSPEYGATCGFFPIDQETLDYLTLTGRDAETVALVEAYAKAQGLWRSDDLADPVFTDVLELDLDSVGPSLAGPKRPQDRVDLSQLGEATVAAIPAAEREKQVPVAGKDFSLRQGDVVIAAITSCTNTSNPAVMMGAGLVAKKAVELGLAQKPWVKTSLAPGSKVVTDYLDKAGLQTYLDQLGFNLVGYGCTTCIGNSGPLDGPIAEAIDAGKLTVSAVLSGNRNFEGRIHPQTKLSWLASPPLVVAYALAGTTRIDLSKDPIGTGKDGQKVYLKDLWPTSAEIAALVKTVSAEMFRTKYADVFHGEPSWRELPVPEGETYAWDTASTYVREPSFFELRQPATAILEGFSGARMLALLGDSITTDHISPAGSIKPDSPAGRYLQEHGVATADFNSYGSRRGNHEVMMRGTFANIRLKNELAGGREGGFTRHLPDGEETTIFEASMRYQERRRAAGGRRRQGVRHRLQPRLGRQGDPAAWGEGGSGRELRAHPPLQPDRHGGAAAAVHRRCQPPEPRPRRQRNLRSARRGSTAPGAGADPAYPSRRRFARRGAGPLPPRYRQRDQLLRQRRHPQLRSAEADKIRSLLSQNCGPLERSAKPPPMVPGESGKCRVPADDPGAGLMSRGAGADESPAAEPSRNVA